MFLFYIIKILNMENNFQICIASSDEELQQILSLQKINLRNVQSKPEEETEGFVTVCHTMELLRKMNEKEPHIIIKSGDKVVAYALCMVPEFRNDIPELKAMFALLDEIVDKSGENQSNYLVMGQICIDKEYRGLGLFRKLYAYYFERFKNKYDCILTEVASRNTRSLNAHLNTGFKEIYRYTEPGIEDWVVLKKDFD